MKLDEAQLRAVESTEPFRFVLAGPGSGKTRVGVEIVSRSKRQVIFLTFTNDAADEFCNRVEHSFLYAGTTHGYCFRLLQHYGHLIGYIAGSITILPKKDQLQKLVAIAERLGVKAPRSQLHNCPQVMREYMFDLKRANMVDYDIMLKDALDLLGAYPDIITHRDVLLVVDEVQDSNETDQAIYLAIPAAERVYLGDLDQSIYAFRGARPGALVTLCEQPGGPRVYRLENNYRSTGEICLAANQLIQMNHNRISKQTLAIAGRSEIPVFVKDFEDVGQELAWLLGQDLGDAAILYRGNQEAAVCRDFLEASGVKVRRMLPSERPQDWELAKLVVALLISPDNQSLAERLIEMKSDPDDARDQILRLRADHDAAKQTHRPSNLLTYLAQQGVTTSTIALIRARYAADADVTLDDLHEHMESMHWEERETGEGVHVGTMHSAKGREWTSVILPAFEEGIIPHGRDLSLDQVEEERRLAFVAMTRAKRQLTLTYCRYRGNRWGQKGTGLPSRFIAEATGK